MPPLAGRNSIRVRLRTPDDVPGIRANAVRVVVADVDLALLDQARSCGPVHNHQDAAEDGLQVRFEGTLSVQERPWTEPSA